VALAGLFQRFHSTSRRPHASQCGINSLEGCDNEFLGASWEEETTCAFLADYNRMFRKSPLLEVSDRLPSKSQGLPLLEPRCRTDCGQTQPEPLNRYIVADNATLGPADALSAGSELGCWPGSYRPHLHFSGFGGSIAVPLGNRPKVFEVVLGFVALVLRRLGSV
jgi:hypothetical protein